MPVVWRTFQDFVSDQISAVVANARAIIDSSKGSVTLAYTQAVAGVALWLQGETAKVLSLTRAATSFGTDLDSYYADFEFQRLGKVAASGLLVFARFTPTTQALVPVGARAATGPSGLQFVVGVDLANPAYSAVLGGYVLDVGVVSISVPATCLTSGVAGNVLANTIQSFFQSIPGVDTVNNPVAFANGVDSETDPQFRVRFPYYLASFQSANYNSIVSAILSVQPGIRWLIVQHYDYPGDVWDPGNFFVIIDDGSGTPPQSLLDAVGVAIESKRALGVRSQLYPPVLVSVNVDMIVDTATGWNHPQIVQNISVAISKYLNAAPLDMGVLPISRLSQIAYGTSPGVKNVPSSQIHINGLNSDLILQKAQRPIANTVTVV